MFAYTSIALAPVLGLLLDGQSAMLADPAGQLWQVHDSRAVTALVGLFTVLPFWLMAVFRSAARSATGVLIVAPAAWPAVGPQKCL